MLSKLGVLAETSIKKQQKNHHAIAPAALGGCRGLGQLWEALAELWEALGELWEGLYKEKLSCVMRAAGHPRLRWPHPHPPHSARPSEIKVVLPGAGVVGELHSLTPPPIR